MTRVDPKKSHTNFRELPLFSEMLHSDERLLTLDWSMNHAEYWKKKEEERRRALKRKRTEQRPMLDVSSGQENASEIYVETVQRLYSDEAPLTPMESN